MRSKSRVVKRANTSYIYDFTEMEKKKGFIIRSSPSPRRHHRVTTKMTNIRITRRYDLKGFSLPNEQNIKKMLTRLPWKREENKQANDVGEKYCVFVGLLITMNDFVRCNKLTGVYWLRGPVDQLKIKITLKVPDDVISLPKFEDYTNETSNISLQQNAEEFSFKWQEKCFSEWEVQRYRDVHHCLTENELGYHELVKSEEIVPSKVFTYIHEDYYMPLPQEKKKSACLVTSCLERLSVGDRVGAAIGGRSASERRLFRSLEDVGGEEESWTAMHVVLDNSDYNEGGLVVKREALLLSLFHNRVGGYVTVSPDANQLETNPYAVEAGEGSLARQYAVTVDFGAAAAGGDLQTLLLKLHKKWQKKHKQLVNFVSPPLGSAHYYVTLEIVSAKGFDVDNLYIQYEIKVAGGARCEGDRCGRTHVSEPSERDGDTVYHFGHLIELRLEIDSETEPPRVVVYVEVISTDVWRRHRSRGYAHWPLPAAGAAARGLRCLRPDERGAEERSFFLGGCNLIKDLEVLSRPELQNGDYTYTETGSILVRSSVISQSALSGAGGGGDAGGDAGAGAGGSAAALLVGAEAALRRYRRARARLAQAAGGT